MVLLQIRVLFRVGSWIYLQNGDRIIVILMLQFLHNLVNDKVISPFSPEKGKNPNEKCFHIFVIAPFCKVGFQNENSNNTIKQINS